jgi:TRAP-type mannitol/chloroaromatic compound transport system permease small subunit
VGGLLKASRVIDAVNDRFGTLATWLVLFAVLISTGNAIARYAFNTSSNAWLEVQWYLFSAVFLLCSGYTLLRNEHIRIDIVYGHFTRRTQIWIDIVGTVLFLLPMAIIIGWLSWPMFWNSYVGHEMSMNAGGLIRWPVKLLVPVGFLLLVLQGLSELVKKIAILTGHVADSGEKTAGHGGPLEMPTSQP